MGLAKVGYSIELVEEILGLTNSQGYSIADIEVDNKTGIVNFYLRSKDIPEGCVRDATLSYIKLKIKDKNGDADYVVHSTIKLLDD